MLNRGLVALAVVEGLAILGLCWYLAHLSPIEASREIKQVEPETGGVTILRATPDNSPAAREYAVPIDFEAKIVTDQKYKALMGSAFAAADLQTAYENCVSRWRARFDTAGLPDINRCTREADYWALIGAENGSPAGISVVANKLSSSTDCADRYRSLFWIDKLIAEGYESPWKEARLRVKPGLSQCSIGNRIPGSYRRVNLAFVDFYNAFVSVELDGKTILNRRLQVPDSSTGLSYSMSVAIREGSRITLRSNAAADTLVIRDAARIRTIYLNPRNHPRISVSTDPGFLLD